MPQIYIARQPIYDQNLEVYAYELLYRAAEEENAPANIGDQATYTVLINALTEIGLDEVVGSSYAFVNLTRSFLVNENSLPFSGNRLVLEVLENISADDEVVAGVRRLSKQGYMIALDDFVYHDSLLELIKLCDLIKIDVMALSQDEIREHVELLRPFNVKLLAEKVETQEEFEFCKSLGFDYFQGYFFCKPKILKRRRMPANQLAVMELLSKFQDPDINIEQLCDLVSQDVSLSYRLLRYVNSAMFALPRKIGSIRHAVVALGLNTVKRLAMVLAMSNIDDKPHELLVTALQRAKMCELLASQDDSLDDETCFIVGLFSVLDALLDLPIDELLSSLSLTDEINAALLSGEGAVGKTLACVIAYEQGQWDDCVIELYNPDDLRKAYIEAIAWSATIAREGTG